MEGHLDNCQLSLEITNVLKWDLRCLDARGSLFLPGSFYSTRSAVWISLESPIMNPNMTL